MPDREKVIRALACCLKGWRQCDQCPYKPPHCGELLADATALMKDQDAAEGPRRDAIIGVREPRLMTLEEVTARRGEPAYLEAKSPKSYSGYVLIYDVQTGMGITGVRIGVTRPGHVTIWPAQNLYGIKWRCWTSRPTDEQREATPWEA